MGASGLPPRLDLFKVVAARLVSDDGGLPLSPTYRIIRYKSYF